MNSIETVRKSLEKYNENRLVFVGKLYREQLSSQISEVAFYKAIDRLHRAGELCRLSKGVYYIPRVGKYGIVPLSEREIVSAFTENDNGMEIGYMLYNALGLTTQISKTIRVLSCALEWDTRTMGNVVVQRRKLTFTEPVRNMVGAMEVFQNFGQIQDIDHGIFLRFAESFSNQYSDEVFEEVYRAIKYPKATIAFAENVLQHYGAKNGLSRHLSSLSSYKYPRMEEIYASARIF